jgi:hypothetical protein
MSLKSSFGAAWVQSDEIKYSRAFGSFNMWDCECVAPHAPIAKQAGLEFAIAAMKGFCLVSQYELALCGENEK